MQTPRLFWAVGAFIAIFDQMPDEEVKRLLGALRETVTVPSLVKGETLGLDLYRYRMYYI